MRVFSSVQLLAASMEIDSSLPTGAGGGSSELQAATVSAIMNAVRFHAVLMGSGLHRHVLLRQVRTVQRRGNRDQQAEDVHPAEVAVPGREDEQDAENSHGEPVVVRNVLGESRGEIGAADGGGR